MFQPLLIKSCILALIVTLAGCAQFKNRLSCTLDGKSSIFTSKYMNIGISSEIAEEDLPAECKKLLEKK